MENIIDELIKNKNYLQCISVLRDRTKCFSLIVLLCEMVEKDDTIEKPPSFWDDYAIALFYLGQKNKAYDCYNHVFPHAKTGLSESNVNHFLGNCNHCLE